MLHSIAVQESWEKETLSTKLNFSSFDSFILNILYIVMCDTQWHPQYHHIHAWTFSTYAIHLLYSGVVCVVHVRHCRISSTYSLEWLQFRLQMNAFALYSIGTTITDTNYFIISIIWLYSHIYMRLFSTIDWICIAFDSKIARDQNNFFQFFDAFHIFHWIN